MPPQYTQAPPQQYPQPSPSAQLPSQPENQPEAAIVRNPNSSQNSLLLTELRDSLAVMNDGSFRAVVACKSINFDLMSDREREGIEYAYQSFLNSLYFPVQIYIRSQRVDIGPYLQKLDALRRNQDNMLLGVLMDDYINFIAAIAEGTNIMDKSFYVVIPYYVMGDVNNAISTSKNMLTNLVAPQKQMKIRIDEETYSKAKDEMTNRVGTVVNGLMQVGIRSVQLNTKELGELFYNAYNPDTAVREPLGDFEAVTSTYVQKGAGSAPRPYQRGEM